MSKEDLHSTEESDNSKDMKHKLIKQEYCLKELFCVASSGDNYVMGNLNVDCIYNDSEGNSVTISRALSQIEDYYEDDSIILHLLLLLNNKNKKEHPIFHWMYPSIGNRFWIGYDDKKRKYMIVPENVNTLLSHEEQEDFIENLFCLLKLPLEVY